MSIIYDALKKVEISNSKNTEGAPMPRKGLLSWLKVYALYILCICAGGVFISIIFSLSSELMQTSDIAKPKKETVIKKDPLPIVKENIPPNNTPAPLPPEPIEAQPAPSFILSGTFFSEGQVYALINQQIVKEGDLVDKAMVKRIALNEVELELDGSMIKLSMKH